MTLTADDLRFMSRALQLAERGLYTTHPNPRVGCVVVQAGQVVGEGAHLRAGEAHAEVYALRQAGQAAQGATAYVTLEPCSHFGRTPPCADALVAAGVKRVVVAMRDPNPLVSGRGIQRLEAQGVQVDVGVLEAQARALNPGFIRRMETGQPYVRVKLAMSLDGRTAMHSGESQWITGSAARADVQRWRARSSAVITGIGSLLQDNPQMTVRDSALAEEGFLPQPLRVLLDSNLRVPLDALWLQAQGERLVVCQQADAVKRAQLEALGVRVEVLPGQAGRIELAALWSFLVEAYQVNEVLVEAGAELAGACMAAEQVDELIVYLAPVLLGSEARPLLQWPLQDMAQARRLQLLDQRFFDQDIRLIYQPITRKE